MKSCRIIGWAVSLLTLGLVWRCDPDLHKPSELEEGFVITTWTDNSHYSLGDTVDIRVTAVNHTDTIFTRQLLCATRLSYTVLDSTGAAVYPGFGCRTVVWQYSLDPQASDSAAFRWPLSDQELLITEEPVTPGRYRIFGHLGHYIQVSGDTLVIQIEE